MIRVVIESPFGHNPDGSKCTPEEYARNTVYLHRCIRDSLSREEAPYASHGLFPGALDDEDLGQRAWGIAAGIVWGQEANMTAVYDDYGITEGMKEGISSREGAIEFRSIGQNGPA